MKKSLLLCAMLLVIISSAFAQQMRVSGKVTSTSSGNAVEGISVTVKGAKVGTTTSAFAPCDGSLPKLSTVSLLIKVPLYCFLA